MENCWLIYVHILREKKNLLKYQAREQAQDSKVFLSFFPLGQPQHVGCNWLDGEVVSKPKHKNNRERIQANHLPVNRRMLSARIPIISFGRHAKNE